MKLEKFAQTLLGTLVFIGSFVLAGKAHATTYVVWGTQVQVYAQTRSGANGANMIQSVNGIYNNGDHPWCGRRAYIEFADKELFAAALAASTSKQKVNFIYEDAGPVKGIQGHTSTGCKVISIFH